MQSNDAPGDQRTEVLLKERPGRRSNWKDADTLEVEGPDGLIHPPYPIVCVHSSACKIGISPGDTKNRGQTKTIVFLKNDCI